MSIPSERIYMCKGVPLTNDYKHTLYFKTLTEQLEYMHEKVAKTFSSYTFIRTTNSLKVAATYDEARLWNYMFFQNGTGKIYFAFITNVKYVNDTTTEIFFDIDVMQTYLNCYELKECFVEREHSETDEVGDNLVDEGFELGEFVTLYQGNVPIQDLCLLVLTSVNPNTGDKGLYSGRYGGVWSGLRIYACRPDEDPVVIGEYLKDLDADGLSDGIFTMWLYPKELVVLPEHETWEAETGANVFKMVKGVKSFDYPVNLNTNYVNITRKNNKLLTYPYCYLYVTNNAGSAATYRYEFFNNTATVYFRLVGALSPDATVKMYPINYKGAILNYDEGIAIGGYPTCAWQQDAYKLWLANNQGQQGLAVAGAALTIAGGIGAIGSGGGAAIGVGAIAGGAATIANILAQRRDASVQPPQSKGSFSANVNIGAEFQTFTVQMRAIDEEHRKMIDEYFTRFGYATKRVKTPNTHVRQRFTFTQTVDCQVVGDIGADVLRKIESIFNNGVTIWCDPDTIGNYTADNLCLK